MCSRSLKVMSAACAMAGAIVSLGCSSAPSSQRAFKVCADPNNLPFSNRAQQGFENRLAELVAREFGMRLEYTWFAQRRGFLRNTLQARKCDVVMGVPYALDPVATTQPYYRSTHVFVSREDHRLRLTSLDDPALRGLKIGVHVVGDDYANPPPVQALAHRKIIHNVRGYTIYGDYSEPNPPARLIQAVVEREVDVAIVWGPFGGYFGRRQAVPLRITPLAEDHDSTSGQPFAFAIAMAVRKSDGALRDKLDEVLRRRQHDVRRLLEGYDVPQ
jgi:mxaJ protein